MNCENKANFKNLLSEALKEDAGKGDLTSRLLIPKDKKIKASIVLKERAVIAGMPIAKEIFRIKDKAIKFQSRCADCSLQKKGKIIAVVQGNARSILCAERTALNFLTHLSGIATLTRRFVEKVKPYRVKIMDTRKTIPGLRGPEKYAVACGGGHNHRFGLWDAVLIKDNHLAVRPLKNNWRVIKFLRGSVCGAVKIEIEVKDLMEFQYAIQAKPDIIMLDNMGIRELKEAVKIRNSLAKKILIEASGGVNMKTVKKIAATGVDMISIGCLTNSAPAVDMSLEVNDEK